MFPGGSLIEFFSQAVDGVRKAIWEEKLKDEFSSFPLDTAESVELVISESGK